jgi:hypothetical protein
MVLHRKGREMRNLNGSVVIPPVIQEKAKVCLVLYFKLKPRIFSYPSQLRAHSPGKRGGMDNAGFDSTS